MQKSLEEFVTGMRDRFLPILSEAYAALSDKSKFPGSDPEQQVGPFVKRIGLQVFTAGATVAYTYGPESGGKRIVVEPEVTYADNRITWNGRYVIKYQHKRVDPETGQAVMRTVKVIGRSFSAIDWYMEVV